MTKAKGVPTERSKLYKAKQKLLEMINFINTKEKIRPTPTTSGNDVLPSPNDIPLQPMTQAEGAQRAFKTVQVLHRSLLSSTNPAHHTYELIQLMGPYIHDCAQWYNEAQDLITALQQQLDDVDSK